MFPNPFLFPFPFNHLPRFLHFVFSYYIQKRSFKPKKKLLPMQNGHQGKDSFILNTLSSNNYSIEVTYLCLCLSLAPPILLSIHLPLCFYIYNEFIIYNESVFITNLPVNKCMLFLSLNVFICKNKKIEENKKLERGKEGKEKNYGISHKAVMLHCSCLFFLRKHMTLTRNIFRCHSWCGDCTTGI